MNYNDGPRALRTGSQMNYRQMPTDVHKYSHRLIGEPQIPYLTSVMYDVIRNIRRQQFACSLTG